MENPIRNLARTLSGAPKSLKIITFSSFSVIFRHFEVIFHHFGHPRPSGPSKSLQNLIWQSPRRSPLAPLELKIQDSATVARLRTLRDPQNLSKSVKIITFSLFFDLFDPPRPSRPVPNRGFSAFSGLFGVFRPLSSQPGVPLDLQKWPKKSSIFGLFSVLRDPWHELRRSSWDS